MLLVLLLQVLWLLCGCCQPRLRRCRLWRQWHSRTRTTSLAAQGLPAASCFAAPQLGATQKQQHPLGGISMRCIRLQYQGSWPGQAVVLANMCMTAAITFGAVAVVLVL